MSSNASNTQAQLKELRLLRPSARRRFLQELSTLNKTKLRLALREENEQTSSKDDIRLFEQLTYSLYGVSSFTDFDTKVLKAAAREAMHIHDPEIRNEVLQALKANLADKF